MGTTPINTYSTASIVKNKMLWRFIALSLSYTDLFSKSYDSKAQINISAFLPLRKRPIGVIIIYKITIPTGGYDNAASEFDV